MSHECHPGHGTTCCAQLVIDAAPHGTSSNGYACKVTGGHCLPGKQCVKLLEIFDAPRAEAMKIDGRKRIKGQK